MQLCKYVGITLPLPHGIFFYPKVKMAALQSVRSFSDAALAELDRTEVLPAVRGAVKDLATVRLTVTAAVVAWGLWISWRIYKSDTAKKEEDKFLSMHRVWFGTRPLFDALFNAWATSVVITILMRAAVRFIWA